NDVAFLLADSQAKMAIFVETFGQFNYLEMFRALSEETPGLETLVVVRPGDDLKAIEESEIDFADVMARSMEDAAALEQEAGPEVHPDRLFEICYTSGTTSNPKGCVHTFNSVRATAFQMLEAFEYNDQDIQFGPSP